VYEYEKMIIGHLIRYYRMEKKISVSQMLDSQQETLDDWYPNKCKENNRLFSHKTYERIEKGIPAKKDFYYLILAKKLGMNFELSISLSKKIDLFEKELEIMMRNRNKEDFEFFKLKNLNFYSKIKGCLYFSEIVEFFIAVCDLEMHGIFRDEKYVKLIDFIYPFVNRRIKRMMIYYLYRYYSTYINRPLLFNYVKKACEEFPDDFQFFFVHQSYFNTSVVILEELFKINYQQLSPFEQYLYHQHKSFAYYNSEYNKGVLESIEECIKIAEKENFTDFYLYQSYMRKAMTLYEEKEYEAALSYFIKVYYYNPNILKANLIHFFACFERCHRLDDLLNMFDSRFYKKMDTDLAKVIFFYYKYKHVEKMRLSDLEDYILTTLAPYLIYKSMQYDIIYDDLDRYTIQTRHYKKLRDYKTIVEKKTMDIQRKTKAIEKKKQ